MGNLNLMYLLVWQNTQMPGFSWFVGVEEFFKDRILPLFSEWLTLNEPNKGVFKDVINKSPSAKHEQ